MISTQETQGWKTTTSHGTHGCNSTGKATKESSTTMDNQFMQSPQAQWWHYLFPTLTKKPSTLFHNGTQGLMTLLNPPFKKNTKWYLWESGISGITGISGISGKLFFKREIENSPMSFLEKEITLGPKLPRIKQKRFNSKKNEISRKSLQNKH